MWPRLTLLRYCSLPAFVCRLGDIGQFVPQHNVYMGSANIGPKVFDGGRLFDCKHQANVSNRVGIEHRWRHLE